jgi:hypothetical protein
MDSPNCFCSAGPVAQVEAPHDIGDSIPQDIITIAGIQNTVFMEQHSLEDHAADYVSLSGRQS